MNSFAAFINVLPPPHSPPFFGFPIFAHILSLRACIPARVRVYFFAHIQEVAMKKTVNFRFSEAVLEKLEKLAEGSTRTAVLERLILEAGQAKESMLPEKSSGTVPSGANWGAGQKKKPVEMSVEGRRHPPQEKVQDISATKQVLRRKINPMTGKPFGAVPK